MAITDNFCGQVDGFNTYTYIQLARTSYHTQAQVNVNSKVNMRSES